MASFDIVPLSDRFIRPVPGKCRAAGKEAAFVTFPRRSKISRISYFSAAGYKPGNGFPVAFQGFAPIALLSAAISSARRLIASFMTRAP